ncbi:MAG: phosphatase PAP2 family protein [Solirubrobacterales bacterium]|nr:phosphatase PAP2 family protein [Solirubrobacterales bacterium]
MSWARAHRKLLLRGGVVALIAIAYFVRKELLPDFNLEDAVQDLSEGLGAWTYLLVGALAFLETGAFVGLIAPGEFTVILGGAVAGQGQISLPLIIAITWLCAFLGDSVSFMLGSRLGREFLVRHGEKVRISEPRLKQVEDYFSRHGGKTILIGRFIGLVRALAPFIAGSSHMGYRVFAPYSILGTGLWATGLILVGYFFSQGLDTVSRIVGRGLLAFGLLVGVVVGVTVAYRYLRIPENRRRVIEAVERRPLLRPLLALGRRLRPQVRFLWQRLTPGGLGLELTTLLAVLSVGLFVLVSYWSIVSGDPGPTPGDQTAADLAADIRMGWLTAVAKVVTALGSGYVVYAIALAAAVVLGMKRRWLELAVLAGGVLIIAVLPGAIKDWTERPRPEGGLVPVSGYSFPSGHAAQATLYAWLGVTVALRLVQGLARRSLVIAAGIGLTVVVGLSRVYLGVHRLSDVSAGWALGVSGFALCAAVALIAVHIRQNPESSARDSDIVGERSPAGGRRI